ncbi:MAG: HAD family hydrolase [Bryobacterales bacterium]|nr:HAD family hydrolase [Bryobacterales bacterium]
MSGGVLVFDMDGVLVDVGASYREAIRQTVEHFTGAPLGFDEIQEYKNQGGWNNDWALSHRMSLDRGITLRYEEVVDEFQRRFLGENFDGLILRETWIARDGLLEEWARRFRLAIFTGRERAEALHTLRRFAPSISFDPVVSDEDVMHKKPHPEGLQHIQQRFPGEALIYVGDTVDDARAAHAAGVPFIGVAAGNSPGSATLRALLAAEGAMAVIDNINEMEAVIQA